jgi:hypothetical protein
VPSPAYFPPLYSAAGAGGGGYCSHKLAKLSDIQNRVQLRPVLILRNMEQLLQCLVSVCYFSVILKL